MALTVRLYAVCRDRAQADRVAVDLPAEGVTIEGLKALLGQAVPALLPLLPLVRVAVNQEFATPGARVKDGDEVALIPPVSGGSGQGPFRLSDRPIRAETVEVAVASPEAGAVVTFVGTVRARTGDHQVVALEYEAYEGMAERFLRKIGAEVVEKWPGARVAIEHRVGRLEVGEVSVTIAVACPHRAAAFEACRHAIERLKVDVPIWKKEVRTDGSVWVGVGS